MHEVEHVGYGVDAEHVVAEAELADRAERDLELALGVGSRGEHDVARVDVFSNLNEFATEFVPVRHDSWRTTISVPPDYDPGYDLVFYASCGSVFDYAPAPEVVEVNP